MRYWLRVLAYARTLREFVAPTYRPECHYMRGPGPACAKRMRGLDSGAGAH